MLGSLRACVAAFRLRPSKGDSQNPPGQAHGAVPQARWCPLQRTLQAGQEGWNLMTRRRQAPSRWPCQLRSSDPPPPPRCAPALRVARGPGALGSVTVEFIPPPAAGTAPPPPAPPPPPSSRYHPLQGWLWCLCTAPLHRLVKMSPL